MLGARHSSGAFMLFRTASLWLAHEARETRAVRKTLRRRATGVARPQRYSTFPPSIILVQRRCISSGLTISLVAARNQR
jgi:hypothetical protein